MSGRLSGLLRKKGDGASCLKRTWKTHWVEWHAPNLIFYDTKRENEHFHYDLSGATVISLPHAKYDNYFEIMWLDDPTMEPLRLYAESEESIQTWFFGLNNSTSQVPGLFVDISSLPITNFLEDDVEQDEVAEDDGIDLNFVAESASTNTLEVVDERMLEDEGKAVDSLVKISSPLSEVNKVEELVESDGELTDSSSHINEKLDESVDGDVLLEEDVNLPENESEGKSPLPVPIKPVESAPRRHSHITIKDFSDEEDLDETRIHSPSKPRPQKEVAVFDRNLGKLVRGTSSITIPNSDDGGIEPDHTFGVGAKEEENKHVDIEIEAGALSDTSSLISDEILPSPVVSAQPSVAPDLVADTTPLLAQETSEYLEDLAKPQLEIHESDPELSDLETSLFSSSSDHDVNALLTVKTPPKRLPLLENSNAELVVPFISPSSPPFPLLESDNVPSDVVVISDGSPLLSSLDARGVSPISVVPEQSLPQPGESLDVDFPRTESESRVPDAPDNSEIQVDASTVDVDFDDSALDVGDILGTASLSSEEDRDSFPEEEDTKGTVPSVAVTILADEVPTLDENVPVAVETAFVAEEVIESMDSANSTSAPSPETPDDDVLIDSGEPVSALLPSLVEEPSADVAVKEIAEEPAQLPDFSTENTHTASSVVELEKPALSLNFVEDVLEESTGASEGSVASPEESAIVPEESDVAVDASLSSFPGAEDTVVVPSGIVEEGIPEFAPLKKEEKNSEQEELQELRRLTAALMARVQDLEGQRSLASSTPLRITTNNIPSAPLQDSQLGSPFHANGMKSRSSSSNIPSPTNSSELAKAAPALPLLPPLPELAAAAASSGRRSRSNSTTPLDQQPPLDDESLRKRVFATTFSGGVSLEAPLLHNDRSSIHADSPLESALSASPAAANSPSLGEGSAEDSLAETRMAEDSVPYRAVDMVAQITKAPSHNNTSSVRRGRGIHFSALPDDTPTTSANSVSASLEGRARAQPIIRATNSLASRVVHEDPVLTMQDYLQMQSPRTLSSSRSSQESPQFRNSPFSNVQLQSPPPPVQVSSRSPPVPVQNDIFRRSSGSVSFSPSEKGEKKQEGEELDISSQLQLRHPSLPEPPWASHPLAQHPSLRSFPSSAQYARLRTSSPAFSSSTVIPSLIASPAPSPSVPSLLIVEGNGDENNSHEEFTRRMMSRMARFDRMVQEVAPSLQLPESFSNSSLPSVDGFVEKPVDSYQMLTPDAVASANERLANGERLSEESLDEAIGVMLQRLNGIHVNGIPESSSPSSVTPGLLGALTSPATTNTSHSPRLLTSQDLPSFSIRPSIKQVPGIILPQPMDSVSSRHAGRSFSQIPAAVTPLGTEAVDVSFAQSANGSAGRRSVSRQQLPSQLAAQGKPAIVRGSGTRADSINRPGSRNGSSNNFGGRSIPVSAGPARQLVQQLRRPVGLVDTSQVSNSQTVLPGAASAVGSINRNNIQNSGVNRGAGAALLLQGAAASNPSFIDDYNRHRQKILHQQQQEIEQQQKLLHQKLLQQQQQLQQHLKTQPLPQPFQSVFSGASSLEHSLQFDESLTYEDTLPPTQNTRGRHSVDYVNPLDRNAHARARSGSRPILASSYGSRSRSQSSSHQARPFSVSPTENRSKQSSGASGLKTATNATGSISARVRSGGPTPSFMSSAVQLNTAHY